MINLLWCFLFHRKQHEANQISIDHDIYRLKVCGRCAIVFGMYHKPVVASKGAGA